MSLIKKRLFLLATLSVSISSMAIEKYRVKDGDTLSEIVEKYTSPPPSLYGKNGRIEKMITLNPQIKNANLIRSGSLIHFDKNSLFKVKNVSNRSKHYDYFEIGLGYAARYYSHSQSQTLGSANTGTIFLNNINFFTSYNTKKYSFELNIESYQFKYNANSKESSKQLHLLKLLASYKNIIFGFNLEQHPLFRNNAGDIQMEAETLNLPFIGYKWSFDLTQSTKTYLDLLVSINFLLESSSTNSDIDIDSPNGYGGDINTRLVRHLTKVYDKSLYYFWSNDLSLRNLKRDVTWGTSDGNVNSEHIITKSTVGLKLDF